MSTFTHIVEIFLHVDRQKHPKYITEMTEEFVNYRINFFNEYTLKSILNQTDADFRIFLQTGQKWRHVMEKIDWHPKITLCFNWGKDAYARINTDYLLTSRIDSDDLFHKNALAEVKKVAYKSANPTKRVTLTFREKLLWDKVNGFMGRHDKNTSSCYTHIFPRQIYKNWDIFSAQHFCTHGKSGDRTGIVLPKDMVCIVKHSKNWSMVKQNLNATILKGEKKKRFINQGKFIFDEEIIKKTLSNFGVIL